MADTESDLVELVQSQNLAQLIDALLQELRFGSIELIVHDGRVVQIEKHEKFRLNR
jgi:hypothetical protein